MQLRRHTTVRLSCDQEKSTRSAHHLAQSVHSPTDAYEGLHPFRIRYARPFFLKHLFSTQAPTLSSTPSHPDRAHTLCNPLDLHLYSISFASPSPSRAPSLPSPSPIPTIAIATATKPSHTQSIHTSTRSMYLVTRGKQPRTRPVHYFIRSVHPLSRATTMNRERRSKYANERKQARQPSPPPELERYDSESSEHNSGEYTDSIEQYEEMYFPISTHRMFGYFDILRQRQCENTLRFDFDTLCEFGVENQFLHLTVHTLREWFGFHPEPQTDELSFREVHEDLTKEQLWTLVSGMRRAYNKDYNGRNIPHPVLRCIQRALACTIFACGETVFHANNEDLMLIDHMLRPDHE